MSVAVSPILEADFSEVARFYSQRLRKDESAASIFLAEYKWLSRNPARDPGVPIGWLGRSKNGDIRGAVISVSARFAMDQKVETLQIARSLAADPSCNGLGSALFFAYRSLAERYVLYVINANEHSSRLWRVCNAESVPGSDYRGYREQIRAATIADIWGDIPADSMQHLLPCVAAIYAHRADVVVVRSLPRRYMEAARLCGLIRRNFAQPLSWYIDKRKVIPRMDFSLPVATA